MGYSKRHSVDDCDRCGKHIGVDKLFAVPFLYMDKNDDVHEDLGEGYRQYYVCKDCFEEVE